jgi:adenine-specific DNA-methyltransferase
VSRLSSLMRQIEQRDPQLAADLAREVEALSQRRQFGLNFERHTPETVELYGRPIRKGDKVRFLAPRGEPAATVGRSLWKVTRITRNDGERVARLVPAERAEPAAEPVERAVENLVVVAEFRDPIYPGLVSTGKVERGGDKPFHTVINAENFHALQLLLYTHEGIVDAIYIDPPYNTGAKDWKYNNDYVDAEDAYRHSKWLAFMERRLKLARRLLNPDDSVLIVTIDEREVLRLGLLLEQIFIGCDKQLVTIVTNHAGSVRRGRFTRVEEFAFVVFIGDAIAESWEHNMLSGSAGTVVKPTVWFSATRTGGGGAARKNRSSPVLFYPVHIETATGRFHSVGDPLPLGVDRSSHVPPGGTQALWPLASDGTEQTWQVSGPKMAEYFRLGYARFGNTNKATGLPTVMYLRTGTIKKVRDGEYRIAGRAADGAVEFDFDGAALNRHAPTSVWYQQGHFARDYGTQLLARFVPGRSFPFPKSLYSVEDTLRFFVLGKPNATVVDFFAGSATTGHAVMRLNKQDGGRRRSISVTNNEVGADEQKALRARGLRPGDSEWEALGICDYITKPRLTAAVTGVTPDGEPVRGEYKFTDEFPMRDGFAENVEFFTMTYEAPRAVAHHRSFEAVAPLLWLKAGAQGRRIEKAADDFAVADAYAILFDPDCSREFLAALRDAVDVQMVFVVTDDDRAFQMVCAELPAGIETVRLYSSYLTNFTINAGRE